MQKINRTYLRWLIVAGLIEGCSTLVLFFVAMPMKYYADIPEAVSVVGMIHGVLFIWLVLMFWFGRTIVPLPTTWPPLFHIYYLGHREFALKANIPSEKV